MGALIDFFTLRPVFTWRGLQIVWYVYLLHIFFQFYISVAEISQLLAKKGISLFTWSPNFIPTVLALAAQVLLVRVLIEVAATVLLTPKQRNNLT